MARIPHDQSLEQDPQREILYAMEFRELRGMWRGTRTKLKTLKRYVRMVCRLQGVPRCAIWLRTCDSKGIRWEDGRNGPYIQLDPKWGMNAVTLAHELAHHVTDMKYPKSKQAHGPRFVRVYAEVLHIMRLMPLEGMKAICRKHGVKMARPSV